MSGLFVATACVLDELALLDDQLAQAWRDGRPPNPEERDLLQRLEQHFQGRTRLSIDAALKDAAMQREAV